MEFGYLNNLNTYYGTHSNPTFDAKSVPAQNIEDSINKIVEKVDEEKNKKQNKTAIAVGSSILGLSLLVVILNPRGSSRLTEKLRSVQFDLKRRAEKSKGDFVATNFYKALSGAVNWTSRFVSYTNNINSVKDTYFKQLCTEEKTFYSVDSLEKRKRLKKTDKIVRKILKKPHELITRWGDSLAKHTVKNSYKSANERMDNLESLIRDYSEKLPFNEKQAIREKLEYIRQKRSYFSNEQIDERLNEQERLMGNLNQDMRKFWKNYKRGFANKYINNAEHFDKNLSFWAQDIMKLERERLSNEGTNVVDNLVGNKKDLKGEYRDLIDLMSDSLSRDEKILIEKNLAKTEKSLRYANTRECCDYFDKKRDLILGSAPTDIVSSLILLAISGIALAKSDDKDKRISRLITGIIPTVAGLGTNIVLTSMLYSGTKGMVYGILAGGILSLIGSRIDKFRLSAKNKSVDSAEPVDD